MQLSEKEKMIKGDMYNANDIYLVIERDFAKEIIFKINSLPPIQKKDRKDLFKILIKTKGDFEIEPPFYCDYGYNIEIGENFYANYDLTILDGCKVKIGDNVMIGPKVGIYTATHPTDAKMRILGLEYGKKIVIEDNVWIGGSVTIIAGVRIGKNSVIGAGSVVVNDIPENSIAVGNPCKVIKKNS